MDKNFEKELPEGYREAYSIYAKGVGTAVVKNAFRSAAPGKETL